MRKGLIQRPPTLIEEIERQPLIWSQWVHDDQGRQLGERRFIDWAAWEMGPACSLQQWLAVRCLDADFIARTYGIDRGITGRITEIEAAISEEWTRKLITGADEEASLDSGWWGFFEPSTDQSVMCPVFVR